MAAIDYGALLRVDGKLINKNMDLFMDCSDTGYICEYAISNRTGNRIHINGSSFVYAGNEEFLLTFYRGFYNVISNGVLLYSGYNPPFISETHFFHGLPSVKISRLSPYFETDEPTFDDYSMKTYHSFCESFGKRYADRWRNRLCKFHYRVSKRRTCCKLSRQRPFRFIAQWEHNGKKYEVIFGYGIDPKEEVWNDVKRCYGFRPDEIEIIDSWFKE